MKITKSFIKQIIMEELGKLDEVSTDDRMLSGQYGVTDPNSQQLFASFVKQITALKSVKPINVDKITALKNTINSSSLDGNSKSQLIGMF